LEFCKWIQITGNNFFIYLSREIKSMNRKLVFFGLVFCLAAYLGWTEPRSFIHYTTDDGLPHSGITGFMQDDEGFMWVATRISITRFNGYDFQEIPVYLRNGAAAVLPLPYFLKTSTGKLFLVSADNRIFRFAPENDCFLESGISLTEIGRGQIVPTHFGGFWIYREGLVQFLPESLDKFASNKLLDELNNKHLTDQIAEKIYGNDYSLYVLTKNGSIIVANLETGDIHVVPLQIGFLSDPSLFYIDNEGFAWIVDDLAGLWRIDLSDGQSLHFSTAMPFDRKISHNWVREVIQDGNGQIWIGTESDLCIWNPYTNQMEVQSKSLLSSGLNCNAIYALYCDRDGNVWVGTYFGGINLWSSGHEFFTSFSAGPAEHHLSGREVRSITEDQKENIWIGLEGGGVNMFERETGRIFRYLHDPNSNSLSFNNVHSIISASDGFVYIGTYTGGLNRFDPGTGRFDVIGQGPGQQLPSAIIYSLLQVGDSIFVGTENGVSIYNISDGRFSLFKNEVFKGRIVEFLHRMDDQVWFASRDKLFTYCIEADSIREVQLSNNLSVSFIASDSRKNIWIGDSFRGLRRYNQANDEIEYFNPEDGFPSKRVFGLIEAQEGWYWISTANGLLKFMPETGDYILYNAKSGLPFSQFNYNAFFKDSKGLLYFGGINGIVVINERLDTFSMPPGKVVFTGFDLLDEKLQPGGRHLKGPLNEFKRVVLKHNENNVTIHFSALNYTHPGRTQYSYFLDGFSQDWVNIGNTPATSFTNLRHGTYQFHVRAANQNLVWTNESAVLELVVLPPFWLTGWAYFIYAILFILTLYYFYLISARIEKARALVVIERKEKENQEKLSKFKLDFFTNISHEFRTPLTLIIGPLSEILRKRNVDEGFWGKLSHINTNSQRLLCLINQLMEFRKVEIGKETLNVIEADLNFFVSEVSDAFSELAESRNIDFCLDFHQGKMAWFDPQKLERILFNLLSNSFKNTQEGGTITLSVSYSVKTTDQKQGFQCAEFRVSDNGKGISREHQDKVFDIFFQSERPSGFSLGSGVGLSFTKSLVKLHKGDIAFRSQPGNGTQFRFWIPIEQSAYSSGEINFKNPTYSLSTPDLLALEIPRSGSLEDNEAKGKPLVLIADDEEEIRSFLKESLGDRFVVHLASNGSEALEKARLVTPDLVISDVMMPEMDGLALTRTLKSEFATSHIPVILLSAKTRIEEQYEGLLTGADAYIEKPFFPHLLLQLMENILATRKRNIELFKAGTSFSPNEIAQSKSDREFISKLTEVILDHIDNPELDVPFLLSEMNVSRTLLHLKLKNIANCSATGFVRLIRLKEGARMMLAGEQTISEVAYSTGFSSPAFFSKRFKEHFGMSPKDFLGQAR
jgi:signal transduction histidine kinase/ligand-binding sensor domain-containing protein/DNA-binding response OmpR family regulator